MGHDTLPTATWTIGEYPRHLHKDAGEFVVVQNDEERDRYLADGWHLWPWNDWRRVEASALASRIPPSNTSAATPAKTRGRSRAVSSGPQE